MPLRATVLHQRAHHTVQASLLSSQGPSCLNCGHTVDCVTLARSLTFLSTNLCICKQWTVKTQGCNEESGRPSAQLQAQSNVKLIVVNLLVFLLLSM